MEERNGEDFREVTADTKGRLNILLGFGWRWRGFFVLCFRGFFILPVRGSFILSYRGFIILSFCLNVRTLIGHKLT